MHLEDAIPHIFDVEGTWSDHPDDPGGATMLGVTFATFKRAVDADLVDGPKTRDRLRELTRKEAMRIYRALYWREAGCHRLPDGVDLVVFDAAVNQGVTRAVRFLQRAAGAKADGIFGPQTHQAAMNADRDRLLRDLTVYRGLHYTSLGKFGVFGKGWLRRLLDTYRLAVLHTHSGDG
ncbi:MAG: glycosyl hydrolase 108 family protein [Rhodovibrio sp.]|nr:glycosyl hydrolase 108 family protein [Rhodovibrio sp.]